MAKRINKTLKNLTQDDVQLMFDVVKFEVDRGDDEGASAREYDMWQYVLRAAAAKNPDADKLARVALKSAKLSFRRG